MVLNSEVDEPGIHADRLLRLLHLLANSQFWESSTVHCLYTLEFSQFRVGIGIQNVFIISLVKIWLGEPPHVVVGTLKISLD